MDKWTPYLSYSTSSWVAHYAVRGSGTAATWSFSSFRRTTYIQLPQFFKNIRRPCTESALRETLSCRIGNLSTQLLRTISIKRTCWLRHHFSFHFLLYLTKVSHTAVFVFKQRRYRSTSPWSTNCLLLVKSAKENMHPRKRSRRNHSPTIATQKGPAVNKLRSDFFKDLVKHYISDERFHGKWYTPQQIIQNINDSYFILKPMAMKSNDLRTVLRLKHYQLLFDQG